MLLFTNHVVIGRVRDVSVATKQVKTSLVLIGNARIMNSTKHKFSQYF